MSLGEPGGTQAVAAAMSITGEAVREVARALRKLVVDGAAIEVRPGRFLASGLNGEYPVTVEEDPEREGGVLARFEADRALPVDPGHRLGAKPGDHAHAMVAADGRALLIRIVRRSGRRLPGTVTWHRGPLRFIPDNRREGELKVEQSRAELATTYRAGERVVGELVDDGADGHLVRIIKALDSDTPEIADFEQVCLSHDLPGAFEEAVEAAAHEATADFELGQRRDFRDDFIFTIDPETAKDFDDAIQVARTENGYRIGVHIADVSHFVRPGGAIDDEAINRGTSIYLVNRVIPMLPEHLSNGLCSLRPHEDRYVLSCMIELDKRGHIIDTWLGEGLIRSRHRLTYEQALDVIEGGGHDLEPRLQTDIHLGHKVAQMLRKNRERAGALNLYSVEHNFQLDAEGKPISVTGDTGDVAHQLIEEFMLLANRAVGDWLAERGYETVWRIHEEPDEERLGLFATTLDQYGITDAQVFERMGLQAALRRLADEPETARIVLNYLCLRSFQKAVYAVANVGHYALAFPRYLHFTSPIRRYPDLIVHRLVKHALQLEAYAEVETRGGHLDALARQSTWLEQRAELAERELKSIKAARYLADRIGETFTGVVVQAASFGLQVRLLETGLEGLVPLREMEDDYYRYDGERRALVGRNTGRVLGTGLECDVMVVTVDIPAADVVLTLI